MLGKSAPLRNKETLKWSLQNEHTKPPLGLVGLFAVRPGGRLPRGGFGGVEPPAGNCY